MLKKPQNFTILYVTAKEIRVFKEEAEECFPLKTECKQLCISAKDRIFLVVDRCQQDLKEEKLPLVPFWDRLRILFHKKAHCVSQGGYSNSSLFREENEFYLRWIHILPTDPLYQWISFTLSHSGKIFFTELETIPFLKSHKSPKKLYQMLCYSAPAGETRHIIFKGRHLLLSRSIPSKEDLKKSLYFLSRNFPDIENNIQISMCDLKDFLLFIRSQKKTPLSLTSHSDLKKFFLRAGMICFFSITCLGSSVAVYRGYGFKNATFCLLPKIDTVEASLRKSEKTTYDGSFREAVETYMGIKAYEKNPLKTFEILAKVLKNHPLILEKIKWTHEKTEEITLVFFIKEDVFDEVNYHFDSLFLSIKKTFPLADIVILTAPFNSGNNEVFKGTANMEFSKASLHIRFP